MFYTFLLYFSSNKCNLGKQKKHISTRKKNVVYLGYIVNTMLHEYGNHYIAYIMISVHIGGVWWTWGSKKKAIFSSEFVFENTLLLFASSEKTPWVYIKILLYYHHISVRNEHRASADCKHWFVLSNHISSHRHSLWQWVKDTHPSGL